MGQVARQDFIKYHLREALRGAAAEADGDEALSWHLRAKTKLRLMSMSDEELWELAKQTSCPERPVEQAYKRHKRAVEEHKATASEWINDLRIERDPAGKEKLPDRILIIEGEPTVRRELTSALVSAGFTVACVPDYSESLLKLDEFNPDMVILGEVLPGGDGTEACFRLHSTRGIPIILLGKDSSSKAWIRAVEAGADLYLRRPFCYLELAARVKAILWRYKRRRDDWKEESGRIA